MAIPFIATEISGLTVPAYASGAANKLYVDTISGALDSRIDALAGATPVTWTTLTHGTGISPFEGTIRVSGSTPVTVNVDGYATVSGAAKYAKAEILASGAKYANDYAWYTASSGRLSILAASGDKYSKNYAWYNSSAQRLSILAASGDKYSKDYAWYAASSGRLGDLAGSGTKYTKAYKSGQALKEGAFRSVATGYASISDNSTIAHGLGAIPKAVQITPSGAVTFGIAYKTDITNITVRISAAGSRMVNWRAEV